MSYDFTEEQIMLKDTIARLAKEQIAPGAAARDEKGEFSWDSAEILRENGLFGADFPEKYGGSEMGLLSLCLIIEEIAKVCASTSVILLVHELGSIPIFLAGNDDQKEKYLPKLATGENLVAFGLTESNAGSDVSGVKTKAVREDDNYVLNGTKTFISHADVADVICIAAKTDTSVPGHKGISMFIVEKGSPGLSIGKHENKLGIRGSSTVEIILEDVRIPATNILGHEGMGFSIIMKTLDLTRIPVAAQALGIAQGALDYAISYTKERTQFGKPLFSFQGLQWMMADMTTQIEAARQLTYKAASLFENVPKNLDRLSNELIRYSAMAKLAAADTAMKVTTDAVQLLGGYGFVKEYPVERMMRDAKITQIYEGTSQIQKVVISSTL
ncbi:MAG: acyl-CoA dehydrogenase family protein [Deltaproteobacteria bacterium]|nr:acyl-CoA dehydrogenase family protein [Deltaproteobacteria bacterium]MBW1738379.1 acyl-CoA dehydrogenase family protein [Deltaproteobacteria bacterium]MBW2034236.1 acyl-CoA dehydrogenase family protein [Deltaproteobacteria bacterium]MBW2114807.1 acyl-CoA dehydrogenase family protein [Deltaproteobacteria bacterium]